MRVLYYTIALGLAMQAVNARVRQPQGTLVLTERELGRVAMGGLDMYRQKCRIEEFADIENFDAVCALEADVDCSFDPVFGADEITVERGDWKRWNLPGDEKGTGPWNGLVWVPRQHYAFFPKWVEEYGKLGVEHDFEELTLRDTLAAFPWRYADNMAIWPVATPIVHRLGINAKRDLVPDYTTLYAQALIA